MSDDRREEAVFAGAPPLPPAGSAILALLAVVNLRDLVKHVTASPGT